MNLATKNAKTIDISAENLSCLSFSLNSGTLCSARKNSMYAATNGSRPVKKSAAAIDSNNWEKEAVSGE